jgi:hypothetical protein
MHFKTWIIVHIWATGSPINSVSLVICREMFGIFIVPLMMVIGIFFLVSSVLMGVSAVLKIAFFLIFLPLRILSWMIGLIF